MAKNNINFNLKIEGLDEFIKDAAIAGGQFPRMLEETMTRSVLRVKNDMQENITNKGISNTGNLRRNIYTTVTASKGVIGVGEKYGAAVEFGTRPHFPPVAPLERWAQTKLGTSGLGFVIARKIARVGTKAQPFAEPAFVKNVSPILKDYEQTVLMIVRALGS